MKFIDFGKQLAKPVKFIKQRTAFYQNRYNKLSFCGDFCRTSLVLVGFTVLRILNGTPVEDISTNDVAYNPNHVENTVNEIEDDSEDSKPEDLWDVIADQDENQLDGYRDGYFGYGLYQGGYFVKDEKI